MKKILFIMIAFAAVLSSCNDYETYGDKKEKERNAIAKFISLFVSQGFPQGGVNIVATIYNYACIPLYLVTLSHVIHEITPSLNI